jgi:ADP-ribose pyrophosphatase
MEDPLFERISFKNVLKTKLFDVQKATLMLKSGEKLIHTIVKRNPTVTVIPIDKDGNIFFISQYRYLLKKNSLELVAGFIDEKESPLEAAKRELKEEAGIKAVQWEQVLVYDMNASVVISQNTIFLARDLEIGDSKPEQDEMITLNKLSLNHALEKVLTGQITTSESIIGVLLLDKLMNTKKI